jgi:hypothetical protein
MHKVVTFLRAAQDLDRERFQELLLDIADSGRSEGFGAAAVTINLVRMPPANQPYRPPSDPTAGGMPEYDVILETWSPVAGDAPVRDLQKAITGKYSACHAYAVTETKIYDRQLFPRGRPSAGIKLIGRLMFHADMPDSAARRSWRLHAGLAARVHVGSARYVQHWVDAALNSDCPPARGLPLMHFPTEADFYERFVDSPRGMEEILQDTAHFVASGPRFYTTEYILRAAAAE